MRISNRVVRLGCISLLMGLTACNKPVSCGDPEVLKTVMGIVQKSSAEDPDFTWDGFVEYRRKSDLILIKDPIVQSQDEKLNKTECKATVVLPLNTEAQAKIDSIRNQTSDDVQVMLRWKLYTTSLNAMEFLGLPRAMAKAMETGDQEFVELAKDRFEKFSELNGNNTNIMTYNLMSGGLANEMQDIANDILDPLVKAFDQYDKSKSGLSFSIKYKIETVDNEEARTKISATWNGDALKQMNSMMLWLYAREQYLLAQEKMKAAKSASTAPVQAATPKADAVPAVSTLPQAKPAQTVPSQPAPAQVVQVPPPLPVTVPVSPPTVAPIKSSNSNPTTSNAPAILPSFDCSKASGQIENLICQDAELARLDLELSKSYKMALKGSADATGIRTLQKDWIKNERNKCKELQCLVQQYQNQIKALNTLANVKE